MSRNRAVRFMKNVAPQLLGFGVGLGAKLYVDKYELDPPPLVAGSDVLMYLHNGLVDVRHVFHRWGQKWAAKNGPSVDISETLQAAKDAFESGERSACVNHLRDIFVSGIGSDNGSIAGQCSEYMPWLATTIPLLHKEGLISDMEVIVMLTNTVLQHPTMKYSLMEEYRELVVDLPMKLLHSEASSSSPSTIIFALTVLTVAATNEATLVEQQRQERKQRPWYRRMLSSEPQSPIVQMILKDPTALNQTMACLASGVVVPVYLLSCIFHSDKGCMKTLLSHGYIEASSAYLANSSTIGSESKETEPDPYGIDVIQILDRALYEHPTSVKKIPAELVEKVADTVFRTAVENDGYTEHLRCCISILTRMVDSSLVSPEWLAQKGVIPLVTQTLAWHGRDKLFVQLLSDFAFKILSDDAAKSQISETAYLDLKQAIDYLNNMSVEDESPTQFLVEGDGDSEEIVTAVAELKEEGEVVVVPDTESK